MKKVLIALFSLFLLSATAFAEGNSNFFIGYTMVNMANVNKTIADWSVDSGFFSTSSKSDVTNSLYGGFEVMFRIVPGIDIGPRVGYIWCLPGSGKGENILFKMDRTYSYSAIPALFGASFTLPIGKSVNISAEAFGGYYFGLANVTSNDTNLLNNISDTYYYNGYGGNFGGEANIKFGMRATKTTTFDITLGYRLANIPRMTVTSCDWSGYTAGDVIENSDNQTMVFDFSGIIAGISLTSEF
ncbi:MAG: hypothetical protein LLG37_08790 [Spirochaetia bacterium]|nr:hypothetical protein [Spirochaetia bacterium]